MIYKCTYFAAACGGTKKNGMGENMRIAILAGVSALVLGGAVLGYVATQAGPRECQAVIHVTEADVDVWVDGLKYRIDSWKAAPIVCPLRPGQHALRMSRGSRLLYEESFNLRGGEEVVLTVWDSARHGRTGG